MISTVALLVALLVAGPASAADAGPAAPEPTPIATHYNAGITTGLIIHYTGYLAILAGGVVSGVAPKSTAGLSIALFGCEMAALGGMISTAGFGSAHRKLLRDGFSPDKLYKRRSATLNAVTTVFFVGSVAMGVAAAFEGSFGLAIGSAGLSAVAAVAAVGNVFGPQHKWDAELAEARKTAAATPALGVRRDHAGRLQPTLVVTGAF